MRFAEKAVYDPLAGELARIWNRHTFEEKRIMK
jgi:hypothetical protein